METLYEKAKTLHSIPSVEDPYMDAFINADIPKGVLEGHKAGNRWPTEWED